MQNTQIQVIFYLPVSLDPPATSEGVPFVMSQRVLGAGALVGVTARSQVYALLTVTGWWGQLQCVAS